MTKFAFNTPEHMNAVIPEDRDNLEGYRHHPDLASNNKKVSLAKKVDDHFISPKIRRLLLHAKQSQQGIK